MCPTVEQHTGERVVEADDLQYVEDDCNMDSFMFVQLRISSSLSWLIRPCGINTT